MPLRGLLPPLFGREGMIDLVKALRNRATWETMTGITEPHQHIDWMAADEITRLREENSRMREVLKPFAYIAEHVGEEDALWAVPSAHLRAARAAIREGGKDE